METNETATEYLSEYFWVRSMDLTAGVLATPVDPAGLKGYVRVKVYNFMQGHKQLQVDLDPDQAEMLAEQLKNGAAEARKLTGQ